MYSVNSEIRVFSLVLLLKNWALSEGGEGVYEYVLSSEKASEEKRLSSRARLVE